MDYSRIYDEFIIDRQNNLPDEEEYYEVHHIVPRCMGGSDEAENLVKLRPEDHFFAHLLLAKVHGGKMISALHLMTVSSRNHWGRRFSSRRAYALARRIVAKQQAIIWSADGNPLYNYNEFDWVNYKTGATALSTLYDMWKTYGGSRPSWTAVVCGDKASIRGWLLSERYDCHKPSDKGVSFQFINRDGRTFSGTQSEFASMIGISAASAFRVAKTEAVTKCGWRLCSTVDRAHTSTRDGRSSGAEGGGRVYSLRREDGVEFLGTAAELRDSLGYDEDFRMDVRLSQLHAGKVKSVHGWAKSSANDNVQMSLPLAA